MKKFLLIGVILLSGCTHASVRVDSAGGTTTTVTSVSAGVSGSASAASWVLLGITLFAMEAAYPTTPIGRRDETLHAVPPGALDAGRRVNEVDCSKPIRDWSANLRCK